MMTKTKTFAQYRHFLVLGMARSGIAASGLLAGDGRTVTVCDDDPSVLARFAASDVAREFDERITVTAPEGGMDVVAAVDCIVVSPGVPLEHPVVLAALSRAIPVIGEIELAWHFTKARIVGVTGTNGKSTTVGVIGEILKAAGVDVVVAGNIGTPVCDVLRERDPHTLVLELSSFQLDTTDEFRVDVAVLLNVTPDHLDRYHHSFAEYAASKARILRHADANTVYVYNREDETASALARETPARAIPFSSARRLDDGVCCEDDTIVHAAAGTRTPVLSRGEFVPVGVHNLENAMASVGVAYALDVPLAPLRSALRAYRPLPHRMEMVRELDGVTYVNDSKATNVDATVKSLVSIEGTSILILGGRDKDGDFTQLVPYLRDVRRVLLIGEAAPVIRRALSGHVEMS
ncbi:MAG TPA: UDP-N-acetylmuramoyl-L-alanine--D-glutamate ligase, partial [Candidatus Krumholzibacteria bacterium]|nr:UDP-N-acetylmuramoyl-L-alanine--D-glutamate ligase [Candidatus Krumholzibacteria bacterium]